MGSEDQFQRSDVSWFKANDVTVPATLTIVASKPGNGTLTRTAEKVFRVTYPAGKGIAPERTSYSWMWGPLGDHKGFVHMSTNTELIKEFTIDDSAAETVFGADFELTISAVEGD